MNPHAGEGGELGDEELTILTPAIQAARLRGSEVEGPFAADTLFYRAYGGKSATQTSQSRVDYYKVVLEDGAFMRNVYPEG